jgi:hypothetical protein
VESPGLYILGGSKKCTGSRFVLGSNANLFPKCVERCDAKSRSEPRFCEDQDSGSVGIETVHSLQCVVENVSQSSSP